SPSASGLAQALPCPCIAPGPDRALPALGLLTTLTRATPPVVRGRRSRESETVGPSHCGGRRRGGLAPRDGRQRRSSRFREGIGAGVCRWLHPTRSRCRQHSPRRGGAHPATTPPHSPCLHAPRGCVRRQHWPYPTRAASPQHRPRRGGGRPATTPL